MIHKCPRCSESLYRSTSDTANLTGGLIGALFYGAFGSLECKYCGKIPYKSFPFKTKILIGINSGFVIVVAVVLLISLFWLIN